MTSDHTAFEAFVRESSTRLLRTAVLLCGDRAEAEDLVQDAYTTAFRRWRLVSHADNPVAYVRRILSRTYLKDRRRRGVDHQSVELREMSAEGGGSTRPATYAEHVEAQSAATRLTLLDALATLPALDRAVLVARYSEDLSTAEVAAMLNLTEGACRTRASRALARLRRHFPELED